MTSDLIAGGEQFGGRSPMRRERGAGEAVEAGGVLGREGAVLIEG